MVDTKRLVVSLAKKLVQEKVQNITDRRNVVKKNFLINEQLEEIRREIG